MRNCLERVADRVLLAGRRVLLTTAVLPLWPAWSHAQPPVGFGAPPASSSVDVRSGGVLAESYSYHRQGVDAQVMAPVQTGQPGWYGYGFPVTTHRWGWFGAARYYPTVVWQRGYMGDQKRMAYRRGY